MRRRQIWLAWAVVGLVVAFGGPVRPVSAQDAATKPAPAVIAHFHLGAS
jgi:hypothetical protein